MEEMSDATTPSTVFEVIFTVGWVYKRSL